MINASSSTQRAGVGRRLMARGFVFAAVVAVAMLGNLRSQASEVEPVVEPARVKIVAPERPNVVAHIVPSFEIQSDAVETDVQLVPAIYAWDPDVRFVYFRHVSKWM